MIRREWKFFSPEGALTPGGPYTWVVIDWDLRRWVQVTGPSEALPDEEAGIDAVRDISTSESPRYTPLPSQKMANLLVLLMMMTQPGKYGTQNHLHVSRQSFCIPGLS